MEITATQPVRGASILTLSIAEAKPAPAAAHRPMTMPITAIPMEAGSSILHRSTGAKPIAGTAAIRITNTPATA